MIISSPGPLIIHHHRRDATVIILIVIFIKLIVTVIPHSPHHNPLFFYPISVYNCGTYIQQKVMYAHLFFHYKKHLRKYRHLNFFCFIERIIRPKVKTPKIATLFIFFITAQAQTHFMPGRFAIRIIILLKSVTG